MDISLKYEIVKDVKYYKKLDQWFNKHLLDVAPKRSNLPIISCIILLQNNLHILLITLFTPNDKNRLLSIYMTQIKKSSKDSSSQQSNKIALLTKWSTSCRKLQTNPTFRAGSGRFGDRLTLHNFI